MSSIPVYVGLDYHQAFVQVCVMDESSKTLMNKKCDNSVQHIVESVRGLGDVRLVAVESCCGAADLAEALSRASGWNVTLAHPGYVSRMKLNPDKSDYSDARLLADLCRTGNVARVWLAPECVREMRLLIRMRDDLVGRGRQIKCRMLGVLRQQRIPQPGKTGRWTKWWLAWLRDEAPVSPAGRLIITEHLGEMEQLEARIERIEAELARLTADDPVVQKLQEFAGVGPVTAWTMRAIIGRFDRFGSGKQLARFCAVTPRNASSGQRQADSGLIRAGDMLLRGVLIQTAHRLMRHEPRWAKLAAKMKARGKAYGEIVGTVANRWVRWLHHQMKETSQTQAA
jgi:transposase